MASVHTSFFRQQDDNNRKIVFTLKNINEWSQRNISTDMSIYINMCNDDGLSILLDCCKVLINHMRYCLTLTVVQHTRIVTSWSLYTTADSAALMKPVLRIRIRRIHVFGPTGSGSIMKRYGSDSGSFYHQAKIVRKTLISTV
jgi:hypothetical protein